MAEILKFRSPGRINLIGEHTDYNQGFVLPAAINRTLEFEIQKSTHAHLAHIQSIDMGAEFTVDLNRVTPGKGWENYLLGVLHQIQQRGKSIPGFTCRFSSDLPSGAGLSSSAALECGLAWGLNQLFQLGISEREIIELSQAAEHTYVGTQCGIMDQFACVKGKSSHFILLDCRSLDYTYIPADLGDYTLILVNSMVTHELASSQYNNRRLSCLQGVDLIAASHPEVRSLRDATPEMLEAHRPGMSDEVYKRCRYVVAENDRVLKAVEALKLKDMEWLGQLLSETHRGLKEDYEVSCAELDFLVDQASKIPGVAGARMVGGGFGGCTLNLVRKENSEAFKHQMVDTYCRTFGVEPDVIQVGIGPGVGIPI